jgi:hypothetical protein
LIVFKLMISCLHKPWHKMACLYTPVALASDDGRAGRWSAPGGHTHPTIQRDRPDRGGWENELHVWKMVSPELRNVCPPANGRRAALLGMGMSMPAAGVHVDLLP